jgi:hypothetical protein
VRDLRCTRARCRRAVPADRISFAPHSQCALVRVHSTLTHVFEPIAVTDAADPYPAREEAVRQLREQGRHEEAKAILEAKLVWEPAYKSTDQWMALAAYLVGAARGREEDD